MNGADFLSQARFGQDRKQTTKLKVRKQKHENRRTHQHERAGAALLAGAAVRAVPQTAEASIHHVGGDIRDGTSNTYFGGVVLNPDLPGLSGQLILNVYLAIDPDGTGVGTLSDPVHSTVNSHLAVQQTTRHGNELELAGVVIRSNDPARVGQRFMVTSYVQGDFTSLVLQLNQETFSGQGFHVDSMRILVD